MESYMFQKILIFSWLYFKIDYGFRVVDFFTGPTLSGVWTGIAWFSHYSHSNMLLKQFLAILRFLIGASKNAFIVHRFSNTTLLFVKTLLVDQSTIFTVFT